MITSDASLQGWGTHCLGLRAQGTWNHHLPCSSNLLELKVAREVLKAFLPVIQGKRVKMMMENNGSFVHCEARGHKESTSSSGGSRDLLVCQNPFTGAVCIVSPGPSEHPGRLAEPEVLEPHRMDFEPNIPTRDLRSVGGSQDRFNGDIIQLSSASIFLSPHLSTGSSPGCALLEMALQTSLPVSAYCPDAQVLTKDHGGMSASDCDCSILAKEAMLSPSVSPGVVSSNQTASSPKPTALQQLHSPQPGPSGLDCLEFEKGKLQDLNLL